MTETARGIAHGFDSQTPVRAAGRDTAHTTIPGGWVGWPIVAGAVAVACLVIYNRQRVNPLDSAFVVLMSSIAFFGALRWFMRGTSVPWMVRLGALSEYSVAFLGMCTVGGIASYALATDTSGFVDAALARSDRLLHFDWLAWYAMVARHPALQMLGAAAYASVFVSPWTLLVYMAHTGRHDQARQFLLTFWIAIVMTLLLFPLFPAKGPLDYLWHGAVPYMPTSGLFQGQIIPALRAHTLTDFSFGAIKGVVCAPSFHTVCATTFMAAAWPLARLRWYLIPLNAAMLLSIPVEGTHYLTDMIMGAAVAMIAIVLTRAIVALFARPAPDQATGPSLSPAQMARLDDPLDDHALAA